MLTGWKFYLARFAFETVPPILVGIVIGLLGAPTWAMAIVVFVGIIYMRTLTNR